MNKIIRQNYPISSLPDDLQAGLDSKNLARVVVEEREDPEGQTRRLLAFLESARSIPPIGDDPVERIRKLRDEWDD